MRFFRYKKWRQPYKLKGYLQELGMIFDTLPFIFQKRQMENIGYCNRKRFFECYILQVIHQSCRNESYRLQRQANAKDRIPSSTSWEDRKDSTRYLQVLRAVLDRYHPLPLR